MISHRLLPLVVCALTLLCSEVRTQTYCKRGQNVTDTGGQCLLSANYDVANCCYVCPVPQGDGSTVNKCLSLFDAPPSGYAACGQAGALAARQSVCTGMGGDITSSAFTCLCNGGANTSQINYTVPTAASSTGAPTSSGTRPPIVTAATLLFFVLLVSYATH